VLPQTLRDDASLLARNDLLPFLRKRRLAVLATVTPAGEPEPAVVGVGFGGHLDIFFDALANAREVHNLRKNPNSASVAGWGEEITVRLGGIAKEPAGAERGRMKEAYFTIYLDGRERQKGRASLALACARSGPVTAISTPQGKIAEFTSDELRVSRFSLGTDRLLTPASLLRQSLSFQIKGAKRFEIPVPY
jgi:hypothetical protein